jgi:hypothetical protein
MVESGRLQLYNAAAPLLSSGRYRVRLTHVLAAGVTGTPPPPSTFDVEVGDLVEGLGPVAVHPPDVAVGSGPASA